MLYIPKNVNEAKEYQQQLRSKIWFEDNFNFGGVYTIAGIDASYLLRENKIIVGIVLFDYPSLNVLDKFTWQSDVIFPYIPGYLSFREGGPVLECLNTHKIKADLLVIDGHGIAHPRYFGLACYVGLLSNTPSIGIAKKVLVGSFQEPGDEKGDHSLLFYQEEVVGVALRTRNNVKPVFVSPGHIINLQDSLNFARTLTGKYRIPEPTRLAHNLVTEVRISMRG